MRRKNVVLLLGLAILSTGPRWAPQTVAELYVQIGADVDRDGTVNFSLDDAGEDEWNKQRGAIFLNNCDSDEGGKIPDHADAVINGSEDLKDLAVIRVPRMKNLPDQAVVTLRVDESSKDRIRVFMKESEESYVPLELSRAGNIEAGRLRRGDLEMRIEANSFADERWNGETLLTLSISDESAVASDSVKFKVAPFVLLSNLHRGRTAYVREIPGRNDRFVAGLSDLLPRTGCELQVIPAGPPYRVNDVWLQDAVEIGYTEMPGHGISVAMKANRNRSLDDFARNELLGRDYGLLEAASFREAFARGRGGDGWLDWYGNLEVTPPMPGFPLGRIYYGFNPEGPEEASLNPEIVTLLEAQTVQAPALRLDTGWLQIQHVDEVIAFVADENPKAPFRILVVDTEATVALLREWEAEGLGNTRLLQAFEETATVSSLVRDGDLMSHNLRLQKNRIEPIIETLKGQFDLDEGRFIRVPALFNARGKAVFPNMVNSLVLNGHIFIADPNGPVVAGKDLMKEEMLRRLSGLPLVAHFLDDRQYHQWSGNVHCATNVRRDRFAAHWWQ